jgi:chromosome segregation ATPase
MIMSVISQTVEVNLDFDSLIHRQDVLEKELNSLREFCHDIKEKNEITINRIHERIDKLEKELVELRETLLEVKASVFLVQLGVNSVEKHVSEINAKQDVAITAQDKFIGQLWKAFFTLLGVVSALGAGIVTIMK